MANAIQKVTASQRKAGDVVHEGGLPIGLLGVNEYMLVQHIETSDFSTGCLAIYGETKMGAVRGVSVEDSLWIEVRVTVKNSGIAMVWFEGALGHTLIITDAGAGGPLKTPGPIYLPFLLGEVPDSIDVEARARRGGATPLTYASDEILNIIPTSRFRR